MKGQFRLFSKERLKSSKTIGGLFQDGQTMSYPPLFIKYRIFHPAEGESTSLQVAFAVSKRHFSRAADRNRVKRLMREAYRLNTGSLRQQIYNGPLSLNFIITYTDKKLPAFKEIEEQVASVLTRLEKLVHRKSNMA